MPITAELRTRLPRAAALAVALLAMGCSAPPRGPACVPPTDAFAWVIHREWHTEIGLPARALNGPLAGLRAAHPGAAVFLFGFGKRSWLEAAQGDVLALLAGPLPGAGLMQVTALSIEPEQAFGGRARLVRTPLPTGGWAALEGALAASFATDGTSPASRGGSSFFPAARGYSLAFTCNTWTAEMLRRAGLPVRDEGVVTAPAVMRQLEARATCLSPE